MNILFLCTHNSARSILFEACLNHLGAPRLRAFSAGSSPRNNQMPHPLGLAALQKKASQSIGYRAKVGMPLPHEVLHKWMS